MSVTEWLVIGGGLAVIAWLNWYFLFAERGKSNATDKSRMPERSKSNAKDK